MLYKPNILEHKSRVVSLKANKPNGLRKYERRYIDEEAIKIGDIIFYETSTFFGSIIRRISGYKYSHVAIVVDVTDMHIFVIESVAFKKSKIVSLFKNPNIISLMVTRPKGMTWRQRRCVNRMKYDYVGLRYDHIGVIKLALGLIFPRENKREALYQTSGKWCSAIVDEFITNVGIDLVPENDDNRIDIQTLAESKELTVVRYLTSESEYRYSTK